ncbi:MAG: anaerobic ribonucleoside-triphosphate reductase activating protein [Candidatus Omnitrophota bacterium]|nr:MAG: anaerobic ribonucleoside-triphosphate reductase activating protein [Candidatus Omnitrophota bacterium]
MKIGGLTKTSLIEYPGMISAVVFTQGCNFRCPYCHNPELVEPSLSNPKIPEDEVIDFLKRRKKYLEAVVITGGEPCLQEDLIDFIVKLKEIGYMVKLETNGSFPEVLSKIIERKLVDFISMDIKGPLDKYDIIAGVKVDISKIKESISLIMDSGIDFEFQTTVVKSMLEEKDFEKIGNLIKGAKSYVLQRFVPSKTLNPEFMKEETYSDEKLNEIKKIMEKYVLNCRIR